jgi:predicted RNA-binding Zn-ribbon protein involved in translation (DUF1610 family)
VGEWLTVGEVCKDPADEKKLAWKPGTGIIVNGPQGRTGNLVSQPEHGDIEAHIEFMVPKGSNSGIYFMGRYEIQVLDSWGKEKPYHGDCGGIYERWDDQRKPPGFEGHAPRVNASKAPGEWQSFDVIFCAPRFDAEGKKAANAVFVKILHNGRIVHENVEVTGPTRAATFGHEKPTGPLMLQGDHGPVAYRNLRVRPISRENALKKVWMRYCETCEKTFAVTREAVDALPGEGNPVEKAVKLPCPHCGKVGSLVAVKCRACGEYYSAVVALDGEPCPTCGKK